tara:strand:- start:328 stop:579 length:252 start_codon:yes stop_codon:yes gene_type:complete
MSDENNSPKGDNSYPPMIATNAILQYLREIFMALDNISFQIRTTMNNIVETNKDDVNDFVVKNPNSEGVSDPVIEGVNDDDEE